MKMKLYFLPNILLGILISCNSKTSTSEEKFKFFPQETAGYLEESQVLEINAQFEECGEWGGHEEKMFISIRKDNKFYLKYEFWCANCDSIVDHSDSIYTYGEALKTIEDTITIELNKKQKEAIIVFAQDLAKAKFHEYLSGNAGNSFSIIKRGGYREPTMKISVFGYDPQILMNYAKLLKEMNFKGQINDSCAVYRAYTFPEENN
jgi:hypothetical protein